MAPMMPLMMPSVKALITVAKAVPMTIGDREVDDVASQQEVLEALDHVYLLVAAD